MGSKGKILVTGADGFIGSHVVEKLVGAGFSVRALSYYNSFNSYGWLDTVEAKVLDSVEIVASDVRDPFAMKDLVQGCDVILHLAALIAIPYSYVAPQSYVETNITGTLNLLEAAKAEGIEHFVHTSTSEVYGTALQVPITEEHPLQPQSPYSASKIAADCMALSYYNSFDLPVTVIRPFNTYGPRQSTRAVIPTIITQILSGQTDIHLGALHPTRDFNYVEDTAEGFVAFAQKTSAIGQSINVGTGHEISIQDTALLIAEIIGKEINITSDEQRLRPEKSEVERLLADNSKAQEVLGWTPQYGGEEGLRRGLEKTIEWFAKPENLALYKSGEYTL